MYVYVVFVYMHVTIINKYYYYSFKLNEGQHVCTPEGTMYDPYYYKTTGGLLRNKT